MKLLFFFLGKRTNVRKLVKKEKQEERNGDHQDVQGSQPAEHEEKHQKSFEAGV